MKMKLNNNLNNKCTDACCSGINEHKEHAHTLLEHKEHNEHAHFHVKQNKPKQPKSVSLEIAGMDCADCASKLQNALRNMKGIAEAEINFASAKAKVVFDEEITETKEIIRIISGFGYEALEKGEKTVTAVFKLAGLDCADCAAKLEKVLSGMEGVKSAKINFGASKMTIIHSISDAAIINAVKNAGYTAIKHGSDEKAYKKWWESPKILTTIISGFILISTMIIEKAGFAPSSVVTLYALVILIGGFYTAKSGLFALKSFTLDMNFLMIIAAVGAAAIGEWSEGATVVFLFSLGNALQSYTMDKTRGSIRALMELAPAEALVLKNGTETRVKVENIEIGDIVIVKPGEKIAVDGTVKKGNSAVNQSAITGESMPVDKSIGDNVYAGTVNTHGAMEVEVTRKASDTTLAKIMITVEEAQAQKAPMQHFVDVFAKYYTPLVILGALAVAVIPPFLFGADFDTWFYRALVLLVISCPCALVISTPVSIVSAIGNSSRNGVLIKGGVFMEKLGKVKVAAFDKTGTLTVGKPHVTDIITLDGAYSDKEILSLAASVEKWSEHPIAAAVVNKAIGMPLREAVNFKAVLGKGAYAEIDGKTVFVGSLRFLKDNGFETKIYEETAYRLERQAKSIIFVGSANKIIGALAVADTIRNNSADAVKSLKQAGVAHITMLTGDNKLSAEAIASELGLDSAYSELLPEDKAKSVKALREKYGDVAMIGDGVNDAPALASADIGIAMGVAGSDTAIETADIALMSDDLSRLTYVIKLSRKTLAIIKQNITFAVAVKALFLVGTFCGFVNLWLAVLADTGASVLVTLNGMRLVRKIK